MIDKFLYTGAAPGEKLATQQAVKNMSYGQIGKNILAEGAFGKNVGPASSLRGYDPKYTGKGAIPRNTVFQRMMAPLKYSAGAFNLSDKASNLAGGTPAQRQLYEKVLQSGIAASQAGRNVLGRVLGAALGPAATYASALTAPNVIMASILDGPNVRSGAADRYVGMMGEAMPQEDYAGLADLLGIPEASQALDDEYYDFDKAPSSGIAYSELDDFEAQNAGQFIPEEEKGIFSLGDILQDLGRKGVEGFKDVAGRGIASQALGGAGGMIFGPMGALAGGIAGLFKGGDLFDQPYIGAGAATVDEFGRMYSAEELDRMNALGGYYSEPARSSRRRDARISNMLQRREAGLKIGLDNLARLQEQQRREESARQAAASAMQQSNMESGTGGYQSDFAQDSDFMGGSGTAAEMGSF